MRKRAGAANVRGVEVVNLQKRFAIRSREITTFARALKRRLHLDQQKFNICFVDDAAIRHLNLAYRGKSKATDVLSFPWNDAAEPALEANLGLQAGDSFAHFLGDVVISVDTARRNAAEEGHSTLNEIRWLILHGVLHLLGYDHARDKGEMVALELALRDQLGIAGQREKSVKLPRAKPQIPRPR